MFTGIGFRNFSWMWRFTPKSPAETKMVDKIIRTFRFYMLPELPMDDRYGRYFVVPAEFDIFFMFRGEENSYLNKISSCVLKNCVINYAPTQYQTFRPLQDRKGAPPIEIEMKYTASFKPRFAMTVHKSQGSTFIGNYTFLNTKI